LYPTIAHLEMATYELTGHSHGLPYFREVRVDSSWLSRNIVSLHWLPYRM